MVTFCSSYLRFGLNSGRHPQRSFRLLLLLPTDQQNNKPVTPPRMAFTVEAESYGTFTETDDGLVARKWNFNTHTGREYIYCLMFLYCSYSIYMRKIFKVWMCNLWTTCQTTYVVVCTACFIGWLLMYSAYLIQRHVQNQWLQRSGSGQCVSVWRAFDTKRKLSVCSRFVTPPVQYCSLVITSRSDVMTSEKWFCHFTCASLQCVRYRKRLSVFHDATCYVTNG